ncbi:MAG: N-acetyl-gamma-glutamyl-phosphate reductase [Eubacteriales bacterium]
MKHKIFVDGQKGTTGLMIHERLANHPYVECLTIDYDKRRDLETRKKLLNEADIAILCLPDEAAKESVSLISDSNTRVLDASTAHRINDDWVYGIPELNKSQREKIKKAKRVANPGCHATGFIMSVAPLVSEGIIPRDYPISFHSITGYSGGGKNMIKKYEDENEGTDYYKVPRHYALEMHHKHLPEMTKYSGLTYEPLFTPIVCNYYKGMVVTLPLIKRKLGNNVTAKDIYNFLKEHYKEESFVSIYSSEYDFDKLHYDGGFVIEGCNDTNNIEICVYGNEEQILLMSRFDNLGKGASGAAIQNMNIMLGIDETIGL